MNIFDNRYVNIYAVCAGLFTITATILKLRNTIDWSWWLVFLPVMPIALVLIVFVLILLSIKVDDDQ